jgi:hypothetical protein
MTGVLPLSVMVLRVLSRFVRLGFPIVSLSRTGYTAACASVSGTFGVISGRGQPIRGKAF